MAYTAKTDVRARPILNHRCMNQRKTNLALSIGGIIAMAIVAIVMAKTQWYCFAIREQQQLFIYQPDYISGILSKAGGVSMLVAQWLTQFFNLPLRAVIITTLLLALMTWISWLIINKVCREWYAAPLSLLPALMISVSLIADDYYYQGAVALQFALFAVWLYTLVDDEKLVLRLVIGTVITIALYAVASSAFTVFAFSAIVYDLCRSRKQPLWSLALIVVWLIIGLVAVKAAFAPTLKYALSPLAFYIDDNESILIRHCLSWVALPTGIFLAWLMRKINPQSTAGRIATCAIALCVIAIGYGSVYGKSYNPQVARMQQIDVLARNKQWDAIVNLCRTNTNNPTEANYLNMALAEKGVLCDSLFFYTQLGPSSLLFDDGTRTPNQLRVNAEALYSMGDIAAAQDKAFNAMLTPTGYDPSMLMMVAKCDIIRGEYASARHYIDLLKNTRQYDTWARKMERMLFHDGLVMKDKELARGRHDIPKKNIFVMYDNVIDDLYNILDSNPSDMKTAQYVLAYLMLCKDLDHTYQFIDKYYGTPALKTLPVAAQEALIFYADYFHSITPEYAAQIGLTKDDLAKRQKVDNDYCRSHGVSDYVFNRFSSFRQAYGAYMQKQVQSLDEWHDTFWYYLLFTQI